MARQIVAGPFGAEYLPGDREPAGAVLPAGAPNGSLIDAPFFFSNETRQRDFVSGKQNFSQPLPGLLVPGQQCGT